MSPRPVAALLTACAALAIAAPLQAQQGLLVDGRPAVTQEDGACWNDDDRFVDCGNGTVTDTTTGLIWLQRANCTELPGTGGSNLDDWKTAMQAVAALEDGLCGLSDGSEPGDWRLPTQEEWEATLFWARENLGCTGAAAPTWTNDSGTACISSPVTSFIGVTAINYWSSTIDEIFTGFVDIGNLSSGNTLGHALKIINAGIWPVRGHCTDWESCPNWPAE